MPEKQKSKSDRAGAAAETERKMAKVSQNELAPQDLEKVVGGIGKKKLGKKK